MPKLTPEQLEAEADELIKRRSNADPAPQNPEPSAEVDDSPSDEPQTPPAEPPVSAEDTAPESPEVVSLREQLAVAEDRIKNTQSRMHKATEEAARLRREMAELRKQFDELRASAQPKSVDTSQVEKDYPEIAGPLLEEIRLLKKQLTSVTENVMQTTQEQTAKAHFDAIRRAHPDFDELISSERWEPWLSVQTPVWQRVADQGSSEEVIELLDRFKAHLGLRKNNAPSVQARQVVEPRVPKARDPQPSGPQKRIWSRQEVARLTPKQYEQFEKELDLALAEGRIV